MIDDDDEDDEGIGCKGLRPIWNEEDIGDVVVVVVVVVDDDVEVICNCAAAGNCDRTGSFALHNARSSLESIGWPLPLLIDDNSNVVINGRFENDAIWITRI